MNTITSIGRGSFVFLAMVGLSACASSGNLADAGLDERTITWLTDSLQQEGIFIRERGTATPGVAAMESSRLILDGREILDVYDFGHVQEASTNAHMLANMNPGRDVYLTESLVVVRFSNRDTGLNRTLLKLLGGAL